jgi:hypothetical protein
MVEIQNKNIEIGGNASVNLVTLGCQHLQLRNKLKGIAMQKLILSTLENHKEDISIKEVLSLCNHKIKDYYWVQSPFKTSNKEFLTKYEVLNISEIEEKDSILIKEKIINKKWKKCSHCGKFVTAEWLKGKKKKCWKCRKGFFRYETKIFQNYKKVYDGNKDSVIKNLCDEGYLKKIPNLNKRLDFFHYANNVFFIFESKNKELTELTFADVVRTLVYPQALRDCGYVVEELIIVFNGSFGEELMYGIQKGFAEKFNFKVVFKPIEFYLKENGLHIEKVIVTKTESGYEYKIIEGDSEKINIDLRELNKNEEVKQEAMQSEARHSSQA